MEQGFNWASILKRKNGITNCLERATRGNAHEFLGIYIDFDEDKNVSISMKEYTKNAITK